MREDPPLVRTDDTLNKLAIDYQHTVDDGLFLDDVEPFDALIGNTSLFIDCLHSA